MHTKIVAIYQNDPNKEFYCSESPQEVLKMLCDKFQIVKYKSLETSSGMSIPLMIKDKHNISKRIYFEGLSIEEIGPEKTGIIAEKNLGSHILDLPVSGISPEQKQHSVDSIIKKYFINTIITTPGHITYGPGQRIIGEELATQEVINYFDTQKKDPNPELETLVTQTIEYARAVIIPTFSIKDLKKRSREIAKSIPKKVNSQNTSFATLRPSHYIP